MNQTETTPSDDLQGAPRPQFPAWPHWWPVLIGPVMVAVIYQYDPNGEHKLFSRNWQDDSYVPYVLTLAAFFAAVLRATVGKNALMWLIAAMTLAIFYRELHWTLSSVLAYTTLVTTVLAGRHWYGKFGPFLCRGRIAHWLIMSALTYVFAVAVAKGWMKPLMPNNEVLRDFYEETVENVAHLMLLFTVVFTGRKNASPKGGG